MNRKRLLLSALVFVFLGAPTVVHAQNFLGKSLTKWQSDMDDKDAQVRRGAAFALGKFPNDAHRVVPRLLKRIQDDNDAGVRDAAATSLGDVMQASKTDRNIYWEDAEPVLRQALEKEKDERAMRGVLHALGSFGPQALPLLDKVKAKLTSEKASIRQNAAWALGRMGEKAADAVDALIECLEDRDALVRRDAVTALGHIGPPAAKAAVRPLLAMVEKEDDDVVRRTALEKLVNLVGPEHKEQAKALYPLLDLVKQDPETAHLAAFVLAKIGGNEGRRAVEVLGDALSDEEPEVQSLAAASLGNLGPLAKGVVRELGKALRIATNDDVRRNCAVALALIGPDAKDAVPDLVSVLKSDAPAEIRHFSAEALARIQYPANEEGLPDILKVLAKTEPSRPDPRGGYNIGSIRQRCIWCFFYMPPNQLLKTDAVAVFTKILDEEGDDGLMVRYDAARVLAMKLGEKAPDKAADWLLHMLKNENLKIYNRTEAKVTGAGRESAPGSSTVQASTGGDARFLAAQALGEMGKKAMRPEILAELRKAAADDKNDKRLREEAQMALKQLGAN